MERPTDTQKRSLGRYLGSQIYVKEAVGSNGEIIPCPKIRTMYHGAHNDLTKIVEENGYGPHGRPMNDPRVIPNRAWLRKYHIDEVLQIYHFLTGKFNLIGTRPRTAEDWELSSFSPEFKREALEYGYGLIPPDLCSSKRIDSEKKYVAVHRLHLRDLKNGKSNFPWFLQFLINKIIKRHVSS